MNYARLKADYNQFGPLVAIWTMGGKTYYTIKIEYGSTISAPSEDFDPIFTTSNIEHLKTLVGHRDGEPIKWS